MQFPQATARCPARGRLCLPDESETELAVLLIAFDKGQVPALRSWAPYVKHMAYADESLGHYQAILADGLGWLPRALFGVGLGAGMAGGALLLYLTADELERALDLSGGREACVVLVDRHGRVWWVAEGRVTADKVQRLAVAAEEARTTLPAHEGD